MRNRDLKKKEITKEMNTKMARRFKFFLMKISLANSDKFIGDFATAYRYKLCFGINAPQINP